MLDKKIKKIYVKFKDRKMQTLKSNKNQDGKHWIDILSNSIAFLV